MAALLVLDDGRYVMQLRDHKPGIFYPGHWGCFGGAVSAGESPPSALGRELREELEYDAGPMQEFTRFDFDLSRVGQKPVYRIYYELRIPAAAFRDFVLHEGAAVEAIEAKELLTARRVTPYDAFAIWLHVNRERLAGG